MKEVISCILSPKPTKYDIFVQTETLNANTLCPLLRPLANRFVIITDENVKDCVGDRLFSELRQSGLQVEMFSFSPGEENKNRATKESLENQMFEAKCGRDTCVIALGGGVSTDLAGFISATYCRGLPLVMIPTSLLAMVDASIGGKNGVDVPYGKNLVGSFHQPKYVLIDPLVLGTLPQKELRNGIVEMIKHGLIADAQYFTFLKDHASEILSLDPDQIEKAVFDSCIIKKRIVEEDEKESGKRRLLNLGHTFAHAIEHLTNFNICHGEAVAIGVMTEGFLSHKMGHLTSDELEEIHQIFQSYEVPFRKLSNLNPKQIIEATTLDKKSIRGTSRYIILGKIGVPLEFEGNHCTFVEEMALVDAINWYMNDVAES